MKRALTIAAALVALGAPAYADSNIAQGENDFKKCKACHTIANGDDVIVKGGRTGPNLFGVVGRVAGTEDFKYSASMIAAGEAGLVWTEENLVTYVADPNAFLKEATGDSSARSKMSFKLKDAADIAAYLASLGQE